jgi:hypothetical protein
MGWFDYDHDFYDDYCDLFVDELEIEYLPADKYIELMVNRETQLLLEPKGMQKLREMGWSRCPLNVKFQRDAPLIRFSDTNEQVALLQYLERESFDQVCSRCHNLLSLDNALDNVYVSLHAMINQTPSCHLYTCFLIIWSGSSGIGRSCPKESSHVFCLSGSIEKSCLLIK